MSHQFSDSDPDELHGDGGGNLRHADLSDTIFKAYSEHRAKSSADLSKIQTFLNTSSSGALSCLICLERIKPSDPTWSCSSLCYAVFHLLCIQSWARQAIDVANVRAASRNLSVSIEKWSCPKCRVDYSKAQIPKLYLCFCGKSEPKSDDPWILPHSCGEVCGRELRSNCGHRCLLLCHPGPCPSCPKSVRGRCYCGGVEDVRRCGFKGFSCGEVCGKVLGCRAHRCLEVCHEGSCPPCRVKGVWRCECGKGEEERDCCERVWRCERECERMLACGKHFCGKGCHSGDCGTCPLQGRRSCPCGKRVYEGMSCDVVVPLCGATCEKKLSCGLHRCPERCHRGPCDETCRIVITRFCRCGGLKKQVPCYQDLSCERKCNVLRDCGRHACRRRCCDGDCPPCSEICDKKLRCRNHKCPSPCHRGNCAPCPLMVTISCACGETRVEVPCGTERDQKPPKCPKRCDITPLCRHGSSCKPHKCHYGACPPCRLPCGEEYPCGHVCNLRCHDPKPPPKPEFTLKPKKKKFNHQPESTPGSPCPPCPELVLRQCVGQHFGTERLMVCSDRRNFSCENLCGNLLSCDNHYCTKTCHALMSTPSAVQRASSEPCEECHLPCQKERRPVCSHPCPLPCHPGDCHPCKALVKRSCHCGAMVHVFECIYYNTLSTKEQTAVRSCGGPCHRKLPNCTHLCPETCHPGQCPSPEKCSKKVVVRCGCHTLKKEWLCLDVQAAYRHAGSDPKEMSKSQYGLGLIPCGSGCKSKVQAADTNLQLRKPRVVEVKEPESEKKTLKRRKRREQLQESGKSSRLQESIVIIRRFLLCATILVALIAATYYGYKGLFWLNDWMNENDKKREVRRYPRI